MPNQDTLKLKEKIIETLKKRGASLPVHISNETGLSILFASAFLSELISERKIKTSNLRVGSSPIYFIPGNEFQLEKFSNNLKSKEKDAYLLLKEKKFLEDSIQDPAIRVALRQIKDFAIGFQNKGKIFWRYFLVPESEFKSKDVLNKTTIISEKQNNQSREKDISLRDSSQINITESNAKSQTSEQTKPISKTEKSLEIFDKKEEKTKPKKPVKKKATKKKASQKKNEQFFIKVKEFLKQKQIEIIDIESFNKEDLILKVKSNEKEKLLIAFNKKRIVELDILRANKKAQEKNLPYIILSQGGPLKKLENLIGAVKNISSIERL